MDIPKPEKGTTRPAGDEGTESHECPEQESKPLQIRRSNVVHPFVESLRLMDEFERIRLDFIWTDLDVCITLAAVVKTQYSMGNFEHAERTLAVAEKGYSDMLRFFSQAKGLTAEREKEFQSKFNRLSEQLDGLQRFE